MAGFENESTNVGVSKDQKIKDIKKKVSLLEEQLSYYKKQVKQVKNLKGEIDELLNLKFQLTEQVKDLNKTIKDAISVETKFNSEGLKNYRILNDKLENAKKSLQDLSDFILIKTEELDNLEALIVLNKKEHDKDVKKFKAEKIKLKEDNKVLEDSNIFLNKINEKYKKENLECKEVIKKVNEEVSIIEGKLVAILNATGSKIEESEHWIEIVNSKIEESHRLDGLIKKKLIDYDLDKIDYETKLKLERDAIEKREGEVNREKLWVEEKKKKLREVKKQLETHYGKVLKNITI